MISARARIRAGWRSLTGELTTVNAAPHAHRVAVRAALAILVPLVVLAVIGRSELAAYASFGAFAAVYGGGRRSTARWRLQAQVGTVLSLAVISGALVALSPYRSWLGIPVAAAWAALAASLSDRNRWRPPGPMFPVFAVATASAIPSTPASALTAGIVVVSAALLALGLGVAEIALFRLLRRPPDPPAAPGPPQPSVARQRLHLIRCAIVVLVAGTFATGIGIGHPYWAMVASVTPLTVFTLRGQVVRGVQRVVGTTIGLVVATVLLGLDLPVWLVLLMIAGLQAMVELLVVRNYGLALLFVTPLALLSVQLANPLPVRELITDRFVETLIGVTIGVLAAILTRNRETRSHPLTN